MDFVEKLTLSNSKIKQISISFYEVFENLASDVL